MPLKEIGTSQPFDNWSAARIEDYLVGGQFGTQTMQGIQQTPYTSDPNLQNLTLIKSALESTGKISVLYMKLSWDGNTAAVQNLTFGFVAKILHAVRVVDLISLLPSGLRRLLTDLDAINRFSVYLLGLKQNVNIYVWNWEGITEPYYQEPPTDAEATELFNTSKNVADAINALVQASHDQGIALTIRSFSSYCKIEPATQPPLPWTPPHPSWHKTHIFLTVNFDSDKPLTQSPLAPAIIAAIAIAIVILAGGVVWYLQNISTYKSEILTRITNPNDYPVTVTIDGKEYTIPPNGTLELKETVEGGGANIIAQLPLIIIGVTVIIGGVILASAFIKRKS